MTSSANGGRVADGVIHGQPSKGFFVEMLTNDITVGDSILDIMDNSIDRAIALTGTDVMQLLRGQSVGKRLAGYRISLEYDAECFRLVDNCGGISVEDARERVFLLGNPGVATKRPGLSVYGIGMKRALFKLGNTISFNSRTDKEYFKLGLDIQAWLDKGDNDWDFDAPETGAAKDDGEPGTEILIRDLHDDVSRHVSMTSFANELQRRIASTYALFVEAGLTIDVNGHVVASALPEIGGEEVTPARTEFAVDDVEVLIIAGVTPRSDREQRGTYVFCNGRMVLEADRSQLTGWGEGLPRWHTKYGHFVGFLYFKSDDVRSLPWTTTKTGVVQESAVYQKALRELRIQARSVTAFLNRLYPGDVEEEGIAEREALNNVKSVTVIELSPRASTFTVKPAEIKPEDEQVTIQFPKKARDINRIKKCFPRLKTAKAVGSYAFDYLLKKECQ